MLTSPETLVALVVRGSRRGSRNRRLLMAKVHEVGSRIYWQKLYYHIDNPPLFDTTTTQEIEAPYRYGTCVVARVPFTRLAFILGKWRSEKREVEALLSAMGGRITLANGITDEELEDW